MLLFSGREASALPDPRSNGSFMQSLLLNSFRCKNCVKGRSCSKKVILGSRTGSVGGREVVQLFQEELRWFEMQVALERHLYRFTGPGVATHSGSPDLAGEPSEPPDLDPMTLGKTIHDLIEHRVERSFHDHSRQMRVTLYKLPDQLRADQGPILYL